MSTTLAWTPESVASFVQQQSTRPTQLQRREAQLARRAINNAVVQCECGMAVRASFFPVHAGSPMHFFCIQRRDNPNGPRSGASTPVRQPNFRNPE